MKIALALLLVASTAYADDKDEDVAFGAALANQSAKYFTGAIALPFHAKGIPFRSAGCKQAFGGTKTIKDPKLAPKLATCLGELVMVDPKPKTPPKPLKLDDKVSGDSCSSDMIVGDYELWVELAVTGARPYKVTGVRAEKLDGELGGQLGDLPPMCTKKDPR